MVVHNLARMAFGVVATVSFLLIWSARTAVAQASAYAPAPGPGSGSNYTEVYNTAETDVTALRTIIDYWKTINPNFNSLLPGWSTESFDPCGKSNWKGVLCFIEDSGNNFSSDGTIRYIQVRVGGMTISNTDLAGDLHPAFGNLTGLLFLYITGNPKLTGPIPKELGQLTSLQTLDLHGNNLNGSIPYELGELGILLDLDLSNNQLTGNIPSNLGNAIYLFTLNLSRNKLNGSIPGATGTDGPGLNHLKYLMSLELMENALTGPLPDLRNLSTLTSVNMSYNQLSGSVVLDAIFNVTTNVTTLDLSSNSFSGAFPDFSKLSNSAVYLVLSDNSFDPSTIPSWLINFKHLSVLKMANNSLYGPVPAFLVNTLELQQLEYLNLERNRLDGLLDLQGVPLTATDPLQVLLKSVNLTANNITHVRYDSGMLLSTSGVANVHYMLEDNPFCTEVERKNDTAAKNYFCRNTTTPIAAIYIDDRYRKVVITTSVTLSTTSLVIAVIALLFCWTNRRDKKRLRTQIQKEFAKSDVQPTLYSYNELRAATRDFNQELKVGEGAFGVVYKGVQPDGGELAVKHLLGRSQQGIDEFLNEVVLITGVRHRNLVKLKGCCLQDDKRLLVYEFVQNNNLAEVLFEGKGNHDLNWGVRYNICHGVAQGLHYLHENALPRIIHRDIKAPNILLDKNLSAKIADFGLARLFPDEESHITTVHIAGTTGYLAPEYASRGQLTEKADVFSYGVVVLEIVSGRRNIEPKLPIEDVYLIEHAWRCHEEGRLLDIVDNTLNIQGYQAEVERVINIALLCLQGTGQKRPSMAKVVSLLKGEVGMEVVMRESYSSRPQHASFLKTAQSDPDVTINIEQDRNIKVFEDEPPIQAKSSPRASCPSNQMCSTYVELTTVTPR